MAPAISAVALVISAPQAVQARCRRAATGRSRVSSGARNHPADEAQVGHHHGPRELLAERAVHWPGWHGR